MSVPISIQGTIIEFPSSGQDPNWAPAVIDFAKAVQDALASVAGPFDIAPQEYVMVANVNTGVQVPNLSFPIANVRGAFIRYTVYRNTNSVTVSEAGTMTVVYNPTGSSGNKWQIIREAVGDASVTFSISDTGQVSFSSASISGTGHNGLVTYAAQALLNS